MWLKRHKPKPTAPPHRGPFNGIGVYLDSDVHSVRNSIGEFSPESLINMQASILDFQHRIVEESGGNVGQFIGDCITAYWPSSDLEVTLRTVTGAVERIILEKVTVPGIEYRLVIRFCAAELMGDFFGSSTAFRFQVIGKARSRTESIKLSIPGRDCVFTDTHTYQIMSEDMKPMFAPAAASVYVMKTTE